MPITTNVSFQTDWMATIRARAGIAVLDNVLVFASGGAAITELSFKHEYSRRDLNNSVDTAHISESDTKWGWTVGAGFEWTVTERWSLGAEYLYTDFGSISGSDMLVSSSARPFDSAIDAELNLTLQTVRAFVNFRL